MLGESLASLNNFLDNISSQILSDDFLSDGLETCLMVFGRDVTTKKNLAQMDFGGFPRIEVEDAGSESNLGKGLEYVLSEVMKLCGGNYMPPMLVVVTDGYPSDLPLYDEMTFRIRAHKFSSIIACLAGHHSDDKIIGLLTKRINHMNEMDSSSFKHFVEDAFYQHQGGYEHTGSIVILP